MATFDVPGNPFVAGSTLVPSPPKAAGVDDAPNALSSTGLGVGVYDVRQVDLILHDGKPTVAWVEVDAGGFVRGPYVSAFDGVSWNALGGEVGLLDGLTPTADGVLGVQPLGTRYIPDWPTLASDGTSLYLLYSYRESAAAPTGGFWAPRHEVVKRWNGAAWSDFGKIDPSTNNSKASSSGDGYLFDPVLCASPAEPGVCYASFREIGYQVASPGPFSNWFKQTIVARFDGTSIAGDQQTIAAAAGTGTVSFESIGNDAVDVLALGNESGSAFIFRQDHGTSSLQMIAWTGLVVVQSAATFFAGQAPIGYALRGGIGRYYLITSTGGTAVELLQVAADGSGPFEPYLGSVTASTMPTAGTAAAFQKALMPDGPTNIWIIACRATGLRPTEVWWFHAGCTGWSIQGYDILTIPFDQEDVSYGAAVLLGDTIYLAFIGSFAAAGQLLVEEIPILRDAVDCGGISIHFFDHVTVS